MQIRRVVSSSLKLEDQASIEQLVGSEMDAYRAADVDRLMSLRTDDFVSVPPNRPAVSGQRAARELMTSTFESASILDMRIAAQEVFGSGNLAIARLDVDMSFVPAGQQDAVSGRSKMMFVARRQEYGGWKWTHAIWNHG